MYKTFSKFPPHRLTALSKHFSIVSQPLSGFSTVINLRKYMNLEHKSTEKALKILDCVSSCTQKVGEDELHRRLIRSCMEDLKLGQQKLPKSIESDDFIYQNKIFADSFTFWRSGISKIEDLVVSFITLHRNGIRPDKRALACLFSSCGSSKALDVGAQLHSLTMKIGFAKSSSVGVSLISLYSKCHRLESSILVFLEMPIRNTISWTAIITAHAQHHQHDACLYLFNLMMKSTSKPNDFTCVTILGTCRSSASLGLGRSFHCLELSMGLDSCTPVLNAMISMYAKSGGIEETHKVFDRMTCRDQITWNSMIFLYSQYGFAEKAISLLKEMDKQITAPDKISFLGVLSSCRHAVLVEEGWNCFYLMIEHGIEPGLDHYSCIVDLLGRAGLLEEALDFIGKMSVPPSGVIWASLLSASRVHGNVTMGIRAAKKPSFTSS
ncbi:Pentatricopeptide repeat-containing protein [Platanthera guangdongensis]|uniref:Pentatricopeptide repeat-containing protein n=1 Tax=Platanthera guangdongensis TaxID=2320717 RepID=A0ABR2LU51_9ASPA